MSEWRKFAEGRELDQALANHLAAQLKTAIARRGQAGLAVSGGSTPKRMFELLSQQELEWSKVWITLVDERWVTPDSPDSNEGLVRRHLLRGQATTANFVPLKSDHDNAEDGLQAVSEGLHEVPLPFTAVILGMGGDGHTASWFPQAANLAALLDPAGTETVAATHPVTAPHQRITLTFPAVLNSEEILLHIAGESKRTILEQAVAEGYPVASILSQSSTPATIWWAP